MPNESKSCQTPSTSKLCQPFDALKLENQLCFPIYLCSKEITRRYRPLLEKLDLTYSQYVAMLYLWEHKTATVGELGKVMMMDSNTLSPILKKLEEKDYLVRERSNEDERNVELTLTETGAKLKNRAKEVPVKMGKCLDLSAKDAAEIYRLLYKILANVERN
ncbi:MarR family transcriptional regulator [Candidatus Saccharibacteria bacterium]|nr:MarR family transcriptional regulator [Candidatus Saccharibacteria bacterium]